MTLHAKFGPILDRQHDEIVLNWAPADVTLLWEVANKAHICKRVVNGFVTRGDEQKIVLKLTECQTTSDEDVLKPILYKLWEILAGAEYAKTRRSKSNKKGVAARHTPRGAKLAPR